MITDLQEQELGFQGAGNRLYYLVLGGSYMSVYSCKKLLSGALQI